MEWKMICEKCGKIFTRHKKKGTRRSNSKICPKCKNLTHKCFFCKNKILNPKPKKKFCCKECYKKYLKEYNKKYYRKMMKALKKHSKF
jgi:hypothetical protein